MKFSCLNENLGHGLAYLAKAVAKRSTLPILLNVKIAAAFDGKGLMLETTNLEIGMRVSVPAMVLDAGACTVSYEKLSSLSRTLPNEKVDFDWDDKDNSLSLACGRHKSKIKGLEATEFPVIPPVEGEMTIVDAPVFREALAYTGMAAATDNSRPQLQCVHIEPLADGRLVFETADGFRLSRVEIPYSGRLVEKDLLVPASSLIGLASLSKDQETVEFRASPTGTQFLGRTGGIELISQLVEANYPDLSQIVPKNMTGTANVLAADLKRATRQAMVFADSKIVRLCVTPYEAADGEAPTAGTLLVQGTGAETGHSLTELGITLEGFEEPIEIAFNGGFLIDVCEVAKGSLHLGLVNPASPGTFRDDSPSFVHVVMPMSIGR